jgi:hypothetical protein
MHKETKMKNDDERPGSHVLFSRMAFDDETTARLKCSTRRARGLQELLSQLMTLRHHHEGQSIHIDAESKVALCHAIDETRALISMIAAKDEDELRVKCAALADPTPIVSSNELLPLIAQTSIRSDIFRLKPRRPLPGWLAKWLTA